MRVNLVSFWHVQYVSDYLHVRELESSAALPNVEGRGL